MTTSRELPVVRGLNALLEICWLFIVITIPWFFNVRDYRVFEPDKIAVLRNTVLVMVVLVLFKVLALAPAYLAAWLGTTDGPRTRSFTQDLRRALARRPIVVATLVFGLVYILATITSIEPRISFWGSYDRQEGTFTYLCYIALSLIVATHLRTWPQVERLITAIVFASIPVSAYSLLQHFNGDPLVWADGNQTALRTPSTMGNPIFLAAYVLMTVPFGLYRLVLRGQDLLARLAANSLHPFPVWQAVAVAGYAGAVILELVAVVYSASRGPFLGLLAALVVFGLSLALRLRVRWLIQTMVALAVLLVLVFGLTNTVYKSGASSGGLSRLLHLLPSESGSSEVRSLLWKSSIGLVERHPVLGCGPEVLIFCWYPYYPPDLLSVEAANAAPDRSHNEEIDIVLTTGVIGAIAYLAWIMASIAVLVRLLLRAPSTPAVLFVSALLAAFLGHLVEGLTGIAFSCTLMMLWVIVGAATALDATSGTAAFWYGSREETERIDTPMPAATADVRTVEPGSSAGPGEPRPVSRSRPSGLASMERSRRSTRSQIRSTQGRSQGAGAQERSMRTAAQPLLGRLSGLGMAIYGAGAVLTAVISILFLALFVADIQGIMADVNFREGQNYEAAAGQMVTQSSSYQEGLQVFSSAIQFYQDALNTVPNWGWPPPQDSYRLFLGKTDLEFAQALQNGNANGAQSTLVMQQVQAALQVFQQAARDNPLNPDHPRNIAKLYTFWAFLPISTNAIGELVLADQYFAQASALAPHNPDILDEWAYLDIQLGTTDTAAAHTWFAKALQHLVAAKNLYAQDGVIYRDLGTVYVRYAQWADQAGKHQQALKYYKEAVSTWLTALKYAAPDYQKIYPQLAEVYGTILNDVCDAGQYASYGLNAISAGAISGSGGLQGELQSFVGAARGHGCRLVTP